MIIFLSHWSIHQILFQFNLLTLCIHLLIHYNTVCCCSCAFGAGLELRLFLFHLLMQTVSNTHTVPAMNATSRQATTVIAAVAAVDRLLFATGVRTDEDRFVWKDK